VPPFALYSQARLSEFRSRIFDYVSSFVEAFFILSLLKIQFGAVMAETRSKAPR
jgi:hypothetical protein